MLPSLSCKSLLCTTAKNSSWFSFFFRLIRFNSLLTARLILNLKSVSTQEGSRGVSTAAATGGTTSRWEAAVLGDVGNDFEDDDRLGKMGFADPESSGLSGLSETTTLVHRNSGYDDGMAFEMTNRNRPNSGSSLPVYSPLDSPYTQSDISSKDPNGLWDDANGFDFGKCDYRKGI